MIATVFIEPCERAEGLEAYRDRLSVEQIEQIESAPETAIIRLMLSPHAVTVAVIEEG